ncbi:NAD-P-binding protein [Trametes coccinea BRFM310]|uniref:NAD-P-binding protein n=1 Tax=Trametes coccinea (strain BRFM310) TaxID=1353009 RepID=A0A1Y2IA99_TRAC3|nr:NAD-P-binding protein [Trametes coccinea BRFM310]
MSSPRVWFITGASSGFGRLLTEIILEKGEITLATARRPEALQDLSSRYAKGQLLVLKVDVTKPANIVDAFNTAKEAFGRIDVVVNNAAFAALGEVESVREEDARAMFETNFWGAMHVTREAVKFFREVNGPTIGGRLLQISSITGITGGPGLGFYAASKHALEGLTKSLASEIDPAWNIKITLIEPAGFETGGQSKVIWGPPHPAYENPELPATKMRTGFGQYKPGNDPRKGAEAFYNIALVDDPPLQFPIGQMAVTYAKKTADRLLTDIDKYASWSDDMGTSA